MSAPPYVYEKPETRPARRANDYYSTPLWVIEESLRFVQGSPYRILDPGAGDGQWGAVARQRWPNAHLTGIDIRTCWWPQPYTEWLHGDFKEFDRERDFGLIMGNPPYSDAEVFVRRGITMLRPGGELVFLLRLQFLCGQARARGLWREHAPKNIAFCAKRVSFYGEGRTGSEDYCVIHWQKGWHGEPRVHWIG